jgi:hypothetical protein
MKRFAAALLAGGVMFGVITASAASLGGVRSESIGAGTAIVTSCDSDGVDATFSVMTRGDVVTAWAVTLSNLSGDCVGKWAWVEVHDGAGNTLAYGGETIDTAGGYANGRQEVEFRAPASQQMFAPVDQIELLSVTIRG